MESQQKPRPIRPEYDRHGVNGFYRQSGSSYRNPHEPIIGNLIAQAISQWPLDLSNVLDVACGSGEVTLALRRAAPGSKITGMDPFTHGAYEERTGETAEGISFEEIAVGSLAGRDYSLVVCSFALHLLPVSRLPTLLYELTRISGDLLILTPHKRPIIKAEQGWRLKGEILEDRVRARHYTRIR